MKLNDETWVENFLAPDNDQDDLEIIKKMNSVVNKLGYAGFPLKGIDVQLQ